MNNSKLSKSSNGSSGIGRERELARLWQWIVGNRCRVFGVVGMEGIGKSSIAIQAALQMRSEFEMDNYLKRSAISSE